MARQALVIIVTLHCISEIMRLHFLLHCQKNYTLWLYEQRNHLLLFDRLKKDIIVFINSVQNEN